MKILRLALVLSFTVFLAGCGKEPPATPAEVVALPADVLPTDPADGQWRKAPVHPARLIPQDLVEPRLLKPSTAEVRVQALVRAGEVAFRLEWDDPTADDLPGAARFSDACAVQMPLRASADLPAPQMGEASRGVAITYWRASWQAEADGRGDTIRDLYPNAAVDHYPFEAPPLAQDEGARREAALRYAPARALGNAMEGSRPSPVQDLLAEGPGSLAPAPVQFSRGKGVRTKTGWAVVVVRKLPEGPAPGGRFQVAFAVWQGSEQEVGSRKMRTGWIPLGVEKTP